MKMPEMTDEVFLQLAREEDNASILAGSLEGILRKRGSHVADSTVPVIKFAFGSLINLQRRSRQWTIEQLAERAEIHLDEAISIEEDPAYRPEPRAVLQLAKVLTLSVKNLLVLSGNSEVLSPELELAAVRFAARSKAVEMLSAVEASALSEFVTALAEEDENKGSQE